MEEELQSDFSGYDTLSGSPTQPLPLTKSARREVTHQNPAALLIETSSEKYELGREIAKGGMGVIYEAREVNCQRRVAMKIISEPNADLPDQLLMFIREGQITSQLEHPNIVPIYEIGKNEKGQVFYTMKMLSGTTLGDIIIGIRKGDKKIIEDYPLGRLLNIFQKMCDAVAFAHAKGIVHRDLKPHNVMIGEFGEVQVLDWGLASMPSKVQDDPDPADETRAGDDSSGGVDPMLAHNDTSALNLKSEHLFGSPGFMAPELVMHPEGEGDQRVDIYSLGATLYSILTLHATVRWKSPKEALLKIITGDIPPPLSFNPDPSTGASKILLPHCPDAMIPEELSDMAMKAIATDPADRYRSVKELQGDIEAYQNRLLWRVVIDEDFSDPEEVASHWDIHTAKHELRDGVLRIRGGEPQLVLLKRQLPGDVRIDFECRQEGDYLNDVGCLIGGVNCESIWDTLNSGYAFKYGGYTNTFNVLTREEKKIWSEEASPLVSGETYMVRAERIGNRLTLEVDGKQIFSVVDPNPLSGSHRTLVGLIGWIADTFYSRVTVYSLGTPWESDILDMAERHLLKNHYRTAMDLFEEVFESLPDVQRLERARKGHAVASFRHSITQQLPAWKQRLAEAWPKANADLHIDARGLVADIRNANIDSLEPLRGLPLSVLQCGVNKITSLEPLKGMPMIYLDCSANAIESLEPLRGMPLQELNCSVNKITSLDPLRGMPIHMLNCGENSLPEDGLEPLRGMPLEHLNFAKCGVKHLDPLMDSPLGMLFGESNCIEDLSPLRKSSLTELRVAYNQIESLEPLRDVPLNDLNCAANRISDLSPLQGMPLSTLKAHKNRITTLEPIRALPLTTFTCGLNPLEHADAFLDIPPRNFIYLCDTMSTATLKKMADHWWGLPDFETHARQASALLAVRRDNPEELKSLALEFNGHKHMFIAMFAPWQEAVSVSERMGGHLVSITSKLQNEFVASLVPFGCLPFWIGLYGESDGPHWITGERFTYSAFIDEFHAKAPGPKVFRGNNWFYEPSEESLHCFMIEWDD